MPAAFGIFGLALLYSFFSNSYFGWNMNMESDAEVIADGIFALITALGFVTLAIERKE